MLSNVSCRSAIFTTERQALQQTQDNQDDGCGDADGAGAWQQADDEGRQTHDGDGDEEGIFAPDKIADASENKGAEGAHQEAGGKGEERENIARRRRKLAEELRANDRGKRPVEIEIIPFENGAERGGEDHLLLFGRHGPIFIDHHIIGGRHGHVLCFLPVCLHACFVFLTVCVLETKPRPVESTSHPVTDDSNTHSHG